MEKRNNYIKQNRAPSWTYVQRLFRDAQSTKHEIDNTDGDSGDGNDDNECDILVFLQPLHSETLEVIWVQNLACRELRSLASEFKKSEFLDVDKESFRAIRA